MYIIIIIIIIIIISSSSSSSRSSSSSSSSSNLIIIRSVKESRQLAMQIKDPATVLCSSAKSRFYVCIYIYIKKCAYVYIYIYRCVFIYIYIYICIYIYIYTYVYTHIVVGVRSNAGRSKLAPCRHPRHETENHNSNANMP